MVSNSSAVSDRSGAAVETLRVARSTLLLSGRVVGVQSRLVIARLETDSRNVVTVLRTADTLVFTRTPAAVFSACRWTRRVSCNWIRNNSRDVILTAYTVNHKKVTLCFFIVRQHTDARYWYSNSVRLSVCLSVRDVLVSDENGLTFIVIAFSKYSSPAQSF